MYRALSYLFALGLVSLSVVRWTSAPVSIQAGASEKIQASGRQQEDTHAQGGMSTAGAHAAVLDFEKRPITAGGFVDSGPIVFQNVAEKSGLTPWRHVMGTPEKTYILETVGSGVALLDFDNDGWLDIYLVNGSTYDALNGKAKAPPAALFRNNHDGTFTNVAEQAGVTNDRWGFAAAVGDYDNDGWPDLYVTNFGKNRLYHNNCDGTFTDVAAKAEVTLGNWSTGATFGDYDGDGKLDIFVPGYVHYDIEHPPIAGSATVRFNYCQFRGVDVMCGPRGLKGEPDHLFHNNGNGTFTDVSEKAGVSDAQGYYGLTSVFVDVNNDGKLDLLVANDSKPNYLYLNKGNGRFEDASYTSGYAFNENGRETASMGIALGDYRNNGLIDVYNTVFSDDYNPFYRNDGEGNFTDVSYQLGIAEVTIPFLGWGTGFLDYDNDGWKDLFVVNGHVYPGVDNSDWGSTFAERPLLFHNFGGKRFEVIPPVKSTGLAALLTGRGAAFGDLFNNGSIDVLINQLDGVPALLRNVTQGKDHHWVGLTLIGGAKSPRDAVGSTVYLKTGNMRQRGDVISGGSYASSNDQRVHFGLGESLSVDSIEIHWPSGKVEKLTLPGIDHFYTIEEGKGVVPSRIKPGRTPSA
ncbi:MAG: CRTAC1 family protein [Bryobacteraceae bacterium]